MPVVRKLPQSQNDQLLHHILEVDLVCYARRAVCGLLDQSLEYVLDAASAFFGNGYRQWQFCYFKKPCQLPLQQLERKFYPVVVVGATVVHRVFMKIGGREQKHISLAEGNLAPVERLDSATVSYVYEQEVIMSVQSGGGMPLRLVGVANILLQQPFFWC